MAIKDKRRFLVEAMDTLRTDRDENLLKLDRYVRGEQDPPYMPDSADAEYELLIERSITNVMGFVVQAPAQGLYVDSIRPGKRDRGESRTSADKIASSIYDKAWDHWQKSRLDERQSPVYRGAFKHGHAFVLTEKVKGDVISKGMSALTTTALYESAADDLDPVWAFHVTQWPKDDKHGSGWAWDDTFKYPVTFKALSDTTPDSITIGKGKRHGAQECPVTRFAAEVDLEGRTTGVVGPMIPVQDRINQTVFDLLMAQTYTAHQIRTITGMAPPVQMKAIDKDGNEVLDPEKNEDLVDDWVPRISPSTGKPIPASFNMSAKRVMWAEDPDTEFGTLPGATLDGFISAINLGFQHMAALSQTPPHHLLGQIANLSGDALTAAESALMRAIEEYKHLFGESWERVFRIAAQIGGWEGADDWHAEVVWRDVGNKSLSAIADGLGKISEQLGVPGRGLWGRIPNVTANELSDWNTLYEAERPDIAASQRVSPSGTGGSAERPSFRLNSTGDTGAQELV